jgi:hypothetical protein
MKIRLCDRCNKKIEGIFIKCCYSSMKDKQQTLKHIGDLCSKCWAEVIKP